MAPRKEGRSYVKIAVAAILVAIALGYYSAQILEHWEQVKGFSFRLDWLALFCSLVILALAYLLEVVLWKICLSEKRKTQPSVVDLIAVIGLSDLMRYIPGRLWGVATQWFLLKRHKVTKSEVFYINLISMAGSVFIAGYLVVLYLYRYAGLIDNQWLWVLWSGLLTGNLTYLFWNSWFVNRAVRLINSVRTVNVGQFFWGWRSLLLVELTCALSVFLIGLSGYFLLKGVGLIVTADEALLVLISIHISWVISHLAFLLPRGAVVREGAMLALLSKAAVIETAIIFPLLFRLLVTLADLIFAAVAALVVWRRGWLVSGESLFDVREHGLNDGGSYEA